jgi:FixJ family two-component response regulator
VVEIETLISAINQAGAFRFIPKPWEDEQLLESIREGLRFRDVLVENKMLAQKVRDQQEQLRSLGAES